MKKFYAILAAATIALTATAAPHSISGKFIPRTLKETRAHRHRATAKPLRKSPAKRLNAPTHNRVTARPAGTSTSYIRSSWGFLVDWSEVYEMPFNGACCEIVNGNDGKTYISNLISGYPADAWFECQINNSTLTINGGQLVSDEDGERITLEVLEYFEDDEGGWYDLADSNSMTFDVKNGVITSRGDNKDGFTILGLYVKYEDDPDYDGWTGYGDYDYTIAPFTAPVALLPSGVTPETWAFISEDTGKFVKVVPADDAVYIGGIVEPDVWVKASRSASKVTMPKSAYAGTDGEYYYYLQASDVEEAYDEEGYYSPIITPAAQPLTFTLDLNAKTLTTDGNLSVVAGEPEEEYWYDLATYIAPEIRYQNRKAGTAPMAPLELFDDGSDELYPYIGFYLPQTDVDGNLLDADRLFYQVYLDGELYTFKRSEYLELTENITDVPYTFSDEYDFEVYGAEHYIYYYWEDAKTIGVQALYVEADGSKTYGERVTIQAWSGIDTILDESTATTAWFDLQGRRIAHPANGIFIRKTTDSRGNVRVTKELR